MKMKKIYFVISSLTSGGAERVMTTLANELSAMGYEISIISKFHLPPFYELNDQVKLIYPKIKISYKNIYSTLIGRIKLYINLFYLIKVDRPDLLIPFSTTTNGAIIIIGKLLKIPTIASEHINYKKDSKSIFIKIIKRYVYPHANTLTVLTLRDLKEYYGKYMKNVIVMENPLSMSPLKSEITDRGKTLLAIGDLERWHHKGFDNLLKIFLSVHQKYPEWKLHIAGGGDPSFLKEHIVNHNLSDSIELLGPIKDVKSLLQKHSIFLLTSRYEGLPMVIMEAMSQGLPCIAYDCFTGPGELISNNKDSILIDDQNIEMFRNKLFELIDDEDLRKRLGKNAIETSKKYQSSIIAHKWHKLIEQTLCNVISPAPLK